MKRFRKKKSEFKELEYKPTSVRDLLTEMKDVSELIMDLAYSSLIFDSKDMVTEVDSLEIKMDHLLYQIRMTAMLATRTVKDAEQLSGILQVAKAAENISNAAADIAHLQQSPVEIRPYMPFVLADADEKINMVQVLHGSDMVGKQLGDLSMEEQMGIRVIAIKRAKTWVWDPEGDATVRKFDKLIVRGVKEGIDELRAYAEEKVSWGTYDDLPEKAPTSKRGNT